MTNEERKALIAQGWTPPVTVDPDIAEAWDLIAPSENFDNHALVLASIKRGRELERIASGNYAIITQPEEK